MGNTGILKNDNVFFIAGPCVIESEQLCLSVAEKLAALAQHYRIDMIFKASFDKANRTSKKSFRGPGMKKGLKILKKIKSVSGLPVLTDIHTPDQVDEVASVVDVLQIPAFLCRQTDLLEKARRSKKFVNVKKGQFLSPEDMRYVVEKAGPKSWVTERGTFFGYGRLVVDMAGIPVLSSLNRPVIFDATHSVQQPGAGNGRSSGNRKLALPLARAALAMGVNGLFFETHPNPQKAKCDADNSISLSDFSRAIPQLIELSQLLNRQGQGQIPSI